MTVFLMAARCTAWIQVDGHIVTCTLADDHTGHHTASFDDRLIEWSPR